VVLAAALAVGVLAALTLPGHGVGSATLAVGVGIVGVALLARSDRLTAWQVAALVLTGALLSVTLTRGAPWLVSLCLMASCLVGTAALVGARTWTGLTLGVVSSGLVPSRAARWARRTVAQVQLPGLRSGRAWLVVVVTSGIVITFAALFAAADAAYATLLNRLVPEVDVASIAGRILMLSVIATTALLAACLAHDPPQTDALAPGPGRPLRRWEWVAPLVLLDLLFLSFVVVQLTVLFGGRAHVLATDGLSYAQYARQGFWQLLVVTALTLVVIALAVRIAPRTTPSDLRMVRVLLAVLCLLALVIVASAIHRMSLYQQEYGFTRLRVFVDAVELTLGATYVLLLGAGVRLSSTWLPRATVGLWATALLTLALVNPDAYIARHNVSRYERTGRIDVAYLASLSPDAVPALSRLPAELRGCALQRLAPELRETADPWYDVNLSRVRARRLLTGHPVPECNLLTVQALARVPHD
jgi:hypothetical protein